MRITNDTRIIDLTVGELMEVLANGIKQPEAPAEPQRRLVYGMQGLATLLGCSLTTANRIKASGRIKDAITQMGRTIIIDADKALNLYHNI